MHIVIFSGGNVEQGGFVREALETSELIIAADSGAESAMQFGFVPNIVVGDFDSLLKKFHEDLIRQEVELITAKPEKDETDTQLAVDIATQKGATEISILGGVAGNRLDHVLGNIFLTRIRNQASSMKEIFFINGNQKLFMKQGPGKVYINGRNGDLLSLIPISEVVEHITTEGLQYPLTNDRLFFGVPRGISNVFTSKIATVSFTKGTLIFVHTLTEQSK